MAENAVVGADEELAQPAQAKCISLGPDPRVNHHKMHRVLGKELVRHPQHESRALYVAGLNIVGYVYYLGLRADRQ